jgi:ABC-2 type transport system permease protein
MAALAFMSLGIVVGAVSKSAEGASGLANLIIMPMAFLSGSFIPLDQAPDWLRTVSRYLPLGHLNEGMLDVMVRGQGPSAVISPLLVLFGFAVAVTWLATRLFRWDS